MSRPLSFDGFAVNIAPDALDTAERNGLIDGMPFILMDDGSYDLHINRFFRACPAMGARSPNTWRSYARDILVWARFLGECRGGKTVWQADRHDVLAFHRARRLSDAPRVGWWAQTGILAGVAAVVFFLVAGLQSSMNVKAPTPAAAAAAVSPLQLMSKEPVKKAHDATLRGEPQPSVRIERRRGLAGDAG